MTDQEPGTASARLSREIERQRAYYADTAVSYDSQHEGSIEHDRALSIAMGFFRQYRVNSILDVGCGTGRYMRVLHEQLPDTTVFGVDPSAELLKQAFEKNGIHTDAVAIGDGTRLDFDDNAFDAVMAISILHHVEEPSRVVKELLRVARRMVVISDKNTYGQGRLPARSAKLLARRLGVMERLQWIKHGGQRSYFKEGDGVAYPYSLFDSLSQLEESSEIVYMIPTQGLKGRHAFPLLNARDLVAIALEPGDASE